MDSQTAVFAVYPGVLKAVAKAVKDIIIGYRFSVIRKNQSRIAVTFRRSFQPAGQHFQSDFGYYHGPAPRIFFGGFF
jgi:hypothetical protein